MKYIALDIGNVICRVDFTPLLDHIKTCMPSSKEDPYEFLLKTQRFHDLGMTSIFEELTTYFDLYDYMELAMELAATWNQSIWIDSTMSKIVKSYIDNGVKVALLSNMGFDHMKVMPQVLGATIFDNTTHFFSCEVGARKPSMLYYKTFLDMYPEFKGCTYLDDRIENVEMGKRFGFNAIHFDIDKCKSPKEIKEKMRLVCDI